MPDMPAILRSVSTASRSPPRRSRPSPRCNRFPPTAFASRGGGSGRRQPPGWSEGSSLRPLTARQDDLESGPAWLVALSGDASAVLLDDLVGHGEAQPRTVLLGGEERVEDPAEVGVLDSGALVAALDEDPPVLDFGGYHHLPG